MSTNSIPAAPPTITSSSNYSISPTETHTARLLNEEDDEHLSLVERVKDVMWDNQLVINTFIAGEHPLEYDLQPED